MKNRRVLTLIIIGLVGGLLGGGFWLVKKLLQDREAVLSYIPPNRAIPLHNSGQPQREVVTYTEKDLEEMRKKGITPPGVKQPSQAVTNNEAAVQRSLKTLEEVNRINEMNRRIQEQQERMQRQK